MKLFRLTTAIAIAFMAMSYVDGNTASAGGFTSVAGGAWDEWETWFSSDPAGTGAGFDYPGAGDTATIAEDHVVYVDRDSDACTTLTVANVTGGGSVGGELEMRSGGVLEISGTLTVRDDTAANENGLVDMQEGSRIEIAGGVDVEDDTSPNGIFAFAATSATRPDVRATSSCVSLDGPFTFPGSQGGRFSADQAGDGFCVPSGAATFSGANELELDAPLNANGGDVTFEMDFDSSSIGPFKVTNASSTMTFNQTADECFSPGADFEISAGILAIDQSVRTLGDLTQTGGKIIVAAAEVYAAGLSACP